MANIGIGRGISYSKGNVGSMGAGASYSKQKVVYQTPEQERPSAWRYGFGRELGRETATRWGRMVRRGLRNPFWLVYYIAILAFTIGLFGSFGDFVAFFVTNPGAVLGFASSGVEWASVGIQKVFPQFAQQLESAQRFYENPEDIPAAQTGEDVKRVNEKSVVNFGNLWTDLPSYAGGQAIVAYFDVEGKNVAKDTTLTGECKLVSGKEENVVNAEFKGVNEFKGGIAKQDSYGECAFAEGVPYKIEGEFGIDERIQPIRTIEYSLEHDAISESLWKAYYWHSSKIGEEGVKIIRENGDTDLRNDGIMRTIPRYESEMQIGFVGGRQPYYQDRETRLNLILKSSSGVSGNLEKLYNVKLYVPGKFSMVEGNNCDFEYIEQVQEDEAVYEVYKVKDEAIDKKQINRDCGKEALNKENSVLEEDRCLLIFKNNINFGCGFNVRDVSEEQLIPAFGVFKARAEYKYKTIGRKTINIGREKIA